MREAIMSEMGKGQKGRFGFETEIPPFRSSWIGVLQGTWKEMGMQYGQRAAKDIARNFDLWWKENVLGKRLDWQKKRTPEEAGRYCEAYFQRSAKEFSCLCPELIELFEAIGQGAAKE